MSAAQPRITVLMPVYNGMPHLEHAVESLKNQDYENFLAFLTDDGSTDGTWDYMRSIGDSRFICNRQENKGLPRTLNEMIATADTEYVARLDADDISLPQRFSRQVGFMDAHPEVAVLGARVGYVLGRKRRLSVFGRAPSYLPPMADPPYWSPTKDGEILSHSVVMMRRGEIERVGRYPEITPGQDFELWHRFERAGCFLANLDEMLGLVRISCGGITAKNLERQHQSWMYSRHVANCLARGVEPLDREAFIQAHPMDPGHLRQVANRALIREAAGAVCACRPWRAVLPLLRVCLASPTLVIKSVLRRMRKGGRCGIVSPSRPR